MPRGLRWGAGDGAAGGEGVALPAPATSLALGDDGTDQGLDTLWATHEGGLSTITPRIEGGAAVTRTLGLPHAEPVAAARYGPLTFILDQASESVLVLDRGAQIATLNVGTRPSALEVGDFNTDDEPDLAVANEGSNDVSIILGGPRSTFLPERRIAVGERPRALVETDLDHEAGLDLAVANSGSNSVSLLLGDTKGGFTRAATDLPVGAGPVAFLAADLDGDEIEDLLVADSLDGTLAPLFGREGLPRPGPRVSLPGGADSRPVALEYVHRPYEDAGADVYVAASGTGAVLTLYVTAGGSFRAARALKALPQPVALQTGLFAGDRQPDLAVATADGHVAIIPTPGDRLIAADVKAATVTAHDGAIVWSRRLGPHHYVLATTQGEIPAKASRKEPRPRIGRAKPDTPVLTRRRCGRTRCTPVTSSLDGTHERRLAIRVPSGCEVRDVARWETALAYVVTHKRGCPQRAAGLWLRRGTAKARRMSRFADALGDLRDGRVTWHETLYHGSGWRLRIATLDGKPKTVMSGNLDCCLIDGGAIGGGYVYWVESPDTERASLGRKRLDLRGCQYLEPGDGFPWHGGIGLDRGRPVYVDDFGVFEVVNPRWTRC
ncbi:FG-GAP-like repeat-containing protein [Solirubrobacter soli]|uniref:FG-GAP-like repeat-containing protein n=1 Tax=Solirubrobacter soli TaxID=363832 RepID=UPI00047F4D2B|nr:VCBS repeat-containing protein [Solirubrobacter soli]